jgi:hypothetical protein
MLHYWDAGRLNTMHPPILLTYISFRDCSSVTVCLTILNELCQIWQNGVLLEKLYSYASKWYHCQIFSTRIGGDMNLKTLQLRKSDTMRPAVSGSLSKVITCIKCILGTLFQDFWWYYRYVGAFNKGAKYLGAAGRWMGVIYHLKLNIKKKFYIFSFFSILIWVNFGALEIGVPL